MKSTKEMVHEIADSLNEKATIEDAMYALYVRQNFEAGLLEIASGQSLSTKEAAEELLRW